MIGNKINSLIMAAMKAGEKEKLAVLKLIKAKFIEEKHKPGVNPEEDLPEVEEIRVLRSMVKEREKSAEEYEKAGRQDLVDAEMAEARIIESYLPQVPNEEETIKLVDQVISDLGGLEGLGMKDMKGIMSKAKELSAALDNALLAKIVKSKLQKS